MNMPLSCTSKQALPMARQAGIKMDVQLDDEQGQGVYLA